jgi:hypothetical protein
VPCLGHIIRVLHAQEKSFFLVKNQQVVSWKNGKGRGLTANAGVIDWNYEENWPGSGDFFETPVDESPLRWGEVCFVDLCHCQSPCSEVLARPVANPVLTNKKRRIAPSLGKALHPASQWLHLA